MDLKDVYWFNCWAHLRGFPVYAYKREDDRLNDFNKLGDVSGILAIEISAVVGGISERLV